jgi:hypothetical protein
MGYPGLPPKRSPDRGPGAVAKTSMPTGAIDRVTSNPNHDGFLFHLFTFRPSSSYPMELSFLKPPEVQLAQLPNRRKLHTLHNQN